MKNKYLFILTFLLISTGMFGQKVFTKTGEISFFSSTPMEDIKAVSNSASTVLDLDNGNIQWAVLIKSFEFEKSLMQEHFNENYMESSKYPKAIFKGKISNIENIDLSTDGEYLVDLIGILEIHGVENNLTTSAKLIVKESSLTAFCEMRVKVADYAIEIPSLVKDNIAKEIEIKIKANYEVLGKK